MTYNFRHKLINLDTSVTKELDVSPADWENFTQRYYRHEIYKGVLRSDAISQKLVNDGGEIFDRGGYFFLKDAFDTYGIKARVRYERYARNPYTNDYDLDYEAMIDFTPAANPEQTPNKGFYEVKFIDSSKLQNFVANEDKNYNLSSTTATNGNTITSFSNHPIEVDYKPINVYLNIYTSGLFNLNDPSITTVKTDSRNYTRSLLINSVGDRYFQTGDKLYENTTGDTVTINFESVGTFNTSWEINPTGSPNNISYNSQIRTIIKDDAGSIIYTYDNASQSNSYLNISSQEIDSYAGAFNDSFTYDVPDGGTIEFINRYQTTSINNIQAEITTTATISQYNIIEFYESTVTNPADSWMPYELVTRLIQLMTGETNTNKLLESTQLGRTDSEFQTYSTDGDSSLFATIGGLVLRGYPTGKTKVNLKEWFTSFTFMRNLALWYDRQNDKFKIEETEQVFRDDCIFDLGLVSDLKIRPAKMYYSQMLTGAKEKGKYEEIQGAQEYNIESEHSDDFPVKDKLQFRIPYNNDSLSCEFARRQQYKTSGLEDTKHDEKVIITEIKRGTLYLETLINLDVGTFTGFLGIEERYNGNYTPRQCLVNNLNWIGSQSYKETTGTIDFVNNSKDIIISKDGVSESDSITFDPQDSLYFPEEYEFKFIATQELKLQLDSDPHGYLKFHDENGNEYYCYISTEGIQINTYKGEGTGTFIKANINR